MNAHHLVELIIRHQMSLRGDMSASDFAALRDRVQELRSAAADPQRAAEALKGIRKALTDLPDGNELRQLLREDLYRQVTTEVLPSVEELEALLSLLAADPSPPAPLTPREIVDAVHRRLLDAPALTPAQLVGTVPGDAAWLIRLVDPYGEVRYPAFQFDAAGEPRPVVRRVNRILLADQDPWGAADWWLGGNRWLSGRPADLLDLVPDARLAEAALALVEGD